MDAEQIHAEVLDKYARHVNPYLARLMNFAGFPVEARAEGCYLFDHEGRRYLDCLGGYGVYSLGHRHPKVVEAVRRQLDEMPMGGKAFFSRPLADLCAKLAEIAPAGLEYTFVSNSGTEAVEAALKFVKATTGRSKIVATEGGYHGKTIGALSTTGREKYRKPFEPLMPGPVFVEFGDSDAMTAAVDGQTAAVIIEVIQGEGGIHVAPDGYLRHIRSLCDAHGALMIVDEVQTGLGRTGDLWGVEGFGVEPDLLVTGKGLSGGLYPIAAVVMTRRAGAWLGEQGWGYVSTFGGAELGCLVASRVLDLCSDPAVLAGVRRTAERVAAGLADLRARHRFLTGVRQRGVVIGLETASELGGMQLSRALYPRGVWAMFSGFAPSVLQLKVGLLADAAHCDELLRRLDLALGDVEREIA